METQEIVNLWVMLIMNFQNLQQENAILSMITDYGEGNQSGTTVEFETEVIKSNLCDYSDAYILLTRDITATGGDANTRIAFKNCA